MSERDRGNRLGRWNHCHTGARWLLRV